MRIALIGVRGIPALYSGFETAATEVCTRLAARGHAVTVYCRNGYGDPSEPVYQGVRKRYLPSLRIKIGETLSHTLLSLLDVLRNPPDVLIVFNPASAPFLILARIFRLPYAVNVDGLEWRRTKWPLLGRAYFYFACWLCARTAPWIIADSRAIQRIYRERWNRESYFATYGAYLSGSELPAALDDYSLRRGAYFLVVARQEPENNTDLIVRAFRQVRTDMSLIIVGGTRYRSRYAEGLRRHSDDPRIRFLGGIYEPQRLNEILCNAFAYVHGHMVGGTNPILLQALGAGRCVLYLDDAEGFNREVAGDAGLPFAHDVEHLRDCMQRLVDDPDIASIYHDRAQARVRDSYNWDLVADQYETLCHKMLEGAAPGKQRRFTREYLRNSDGSRAARTDV